MLQILPDLMFFFFVISLQFLTYYFNSQNLVFKFKVSYDPSFFFMSSKSLRRHSRRQCHEKYAEIYVIHLDRLVSNVACCLSCVNKLFFKYYVVKLLSQSFPNLVCSISICKTMRRVIINFITIQRAFCFEYIFLIVIMKTNTMNNGT